MEKYSPWSAIKMYARKGADLFGKNHLVLLLNQMDNFFICALVLSLIPKWNEERMNVELLNVVHTKSTKHRSKTNRQWRAPTEVFRPFQIWNSSFQRFFVIFRHFQRLPEIFIDVQNSSDIFSNVKRVSQVFSYVQAFSEMTIDFHRYSAVLRHFQ